MSRIGVQWLQKWFKHHVFTRKKVVKVHKLNKVVLKTGLFAGSLKRSFEVVCFHALYLTFEYICRTMKKT